jgi:hypothetical protein
VGFREVPVVVRVDSDPAADQGLDQGLDLVRDQEARRLVLPDLVGPRKTPLREEATGKSGEDATELRAVTDAVVTDAVERDAVERDAVERDAVEKDVVVVLVGPGGGREARGDLVRGLVVPEVVVLAAASTSIL